MHQLNFPFEVAKLNDLPSIQGSMGAALVLAMQNISSDKKNDVMGQLDFTFISFVCDILCSSHSDILAKEKLTEDGEKQLRNMLQVDTHAKMKALGCFQTNIFTDSYNEFNIVGGKYTTGRKL